MFPGPVTGCWHLYAVLCSLGKQYILWAPTYQADVLSRLPGAPGADSLLGGCKLVLRGGGGEGPSRCGGLGKALSTPDQTGDSQGVGIRPECGRDAGGVRKTPAF